MHKCTNHSGIPRLCSKLKCILPQKLRERRQGRVTDSTPTDRLMHITHKNGKSIQKLKLKIQFDMQAVAQFTGVGARLISPPGHRNDQDDQPVIVWGHISEFCLSSRDKLKLYQLYINEGLFKLQHYC